MGPQGARGGPLARGGPRLPRWGWAACGCSWSVVPAACAGPGSGSSPPRWAPTASGCGRRCSPTSASWSTSTSRPWRPARDPGLAAYDEPLWLVCTNGRRDRCCTEAGRPVAAALAGSWPEATWETTHLGGHRFAATLLALPSGVALGRLDAGSAVGACRDLEAGRVPVDLTRGRVGTPPRAQVAELHLRRELGEPALDAVRATEVDGDTVTVTTAAATPGGSGWTRLPAVPGGRAARTSTSKAADVYAVGAWVRLESVRPYRSPCPARRPRSRLTAGPRRSPRTSHPAPRRTHDHDARRAPERRRHDHRRRRPDAAHRRRGRHRRRRHRLRRHGHGRHRRRRTDSTDGDASDGDATDTTDGDATDGGDTDGTDSDGTDAGAVDGDQNDLTDGDAS